jgi:hypothetical protein
MSGIKSVRLPDVKLSRMMERIILGHVPRTLDLRMSSYRSAKQVQHEWAVQAKPAPTCKRPFVPEQKLPEYRC